VVQHDNITKQKQTLLFSAIVKTIDDDLSVFLRFKDALPFKDRACAEVNGRCVWVDFVSFH
jgi:hypothetical protein